MKKLLSRFEVLPGFLLAIAVAVPSILLHELCRQHEWSKSVSAVAIAIVAGLLVRNTVGMPALCKAGNTFIVKKVLRLAIILLGVKLSFLEVVRIGGGSLIIVVACISAALLLTWFLARWLKLPPRIGTLIGVGTSICGNSAIVATAPTIDAEDEEVAFAVATITLFGTLAVLVYPLVGKMVQMEQVTFGQWAGTAINDTSQVVAAGKIYGDEAGDVATTVKLTRNLFMAPVIVIMSILYRRRQNAAAGDAVTGKIDMKKAFPLFVLGFLGMAILRTLNVFTDEGIAMIKQASSYLIVLSVAAVGLGTSLAAMKRTGLKPFYVGLAASILMACLSLGLIQLLGSAP